MTFRIEPGLPPQAFSTYRITAPFETHWRKATCEEVDCPAYLNGWRTAIDEGTDRGAAQAYYIRHDSGRSFTEEKRPDGMTVFSFAPGQPCFARDSHRKRLEREENYLRLGGDYRGNPNRIAPFRHTRPEHWVEDMATVQDKLRRLRDNG